MPSAFKKHRRVFAAAQHGLLLGKGRDVALVGGTEGGRSPPLCFVAESEPPHKLQQGPDVRRDFDAQRVNAELGKHVGHRVAAEGELVREDAVEKHEVTRRASSLHYGI